MAGRKQKRISWYKAMHDLEDNPLWPAIAKRVGVSFFEVVGIVRHLWTCASRNKDRGSITNFDAEILAAQAGADQAKIEAVVSALVDKGYIVGGRLVDWARTQGENIVELSTSPGAIRTRRWRATRRADPRQLEMMFVFNTGATPVAAESVTPVTPPVTQASQRRTEGRAKRRDDPLILRRARGESFGRDAPLAAEAPATHTPDVERKQSRGSGPPAKSPEQKKDNKDQLRQKLVRFCNARLPDAVAQRYGIGLAGCDPDPAHDGQWWIDRVDMLMNDDGWDDVARNGWPPRKKRNPSRAKRREYEADLKSERRKAIATGATPMPVPAAAQGPQSRRFAPVDWREPAIPMPRVA